MPYKKIKCECSLGTFSYPLNKNILRKNNSLAKKKLVAIWKNLFNNFIKRKFMILQDVFYSLLFKCLKILFLVSPFLILYNYNQNKKNDLKISTISF